MTKSRILIVDDEDDLRAIVRTGLGRDGYEIVEAGDGMEALDELRREVPSLVLLDLRMPRMDGYQLLARIRSEPAWMALPVVILSGQHERADIERGLEVGADEYLLKPVEIWELKARVAALLKVSELRQRVTALEREKSEAQMRLAGQVCLHMMNAAHEIDGYFDLELRSGPTGERRALVETMAQCSRQLVTLLDALAEYSQLAPSAVETLALRDVLELAAAGIRADWRCTGHQLDLALPDDLPAVRGRKFELGLAFQELLARAARAMPDGGTVRVQGRREADSVAIAVADSGSGRAEQEPLEVEPFVCDSGAPTPRRVALPVARTILEQHAGRVNVEAVPGKGTTVTVHLPLGS